MPRNRRIKGITNETIIEMYNSGIRVTELAKFAGISDRGIRDMLYKNGFEKLKQPRKYKVNEDFFKTWSNEMAYVLGMVITDGCITDNKAKYVCNLQLIQTDTVLLQKILDVMGSEHPIFKDERSARVHRVLIGSQEIVKDLSKLGIFARKSLVVKFPDVPEQYMPHFIRGVIDGDGWVQKTGYIMKVTTASVEFANGLLEVFKTQGLNTSITYGKTPLGTDLYRVNVSGKYDIIRLADWIYQDAKDLYMNRKKERFYTNKKEEFFLEFD